MRKMISNNVICVKDGRVGTMVNVPSGIQADLDKIRIFQETYYSSNLVNNITSFTKGAGNWVEFTNEFCPLSEAKVLGIYGNYLWYLDAITGPEMGNGFKIELTEGISTGSCEVECANKEAQMQKLADVGLYSAGGKVFKAFKLED